MLGAFHAGHSLILQEGGALTTLCVAFVAPIKNSDNYALCVANVGDSLCFVYNHVSGVREVTLASHDIAQMRDMRDAGGALGPVDGRNPQLHNLTCSMTFVQEGDIVFITSDGVSDNLDPVVGKFCVIKKDESEKENCELIEEIAPKTSKAQFFNRNSKTPQIDPIVSCIPQRQRCNATLPCVDAIERHELMLLRMADVIANGVNLKNHFFEDNSPYTEPHTPESGIGTPSSHNTVTSPRVSRRNSTTAAEVCKNLISFAQQLSAGKRRTLEDPELYRQRTHSKTEEKLRRKMIRNMIMEMPGKLDHASVVAFKVGEWDPEEEMDGNSTAAETPLALDLKISRENSQSPNPLSVINNEFRKPGAPIGNCISLFCKPSEFKSTGITLIKEDFEHAERSLFKLDIPPELEKEAELTQSPRRRATRSPYEEQPITVEEVSSPTRAGVIPRNKNKKKSHARGSLARHTLGVDVAWLKRLVINRQPSNENIFHPPLATAHSSQMTSQSSVAQSPITSTTSPPPGSRHHRPSYTPPNASRPFSFKKFFMKPTKSDSNCLPSSSQQQQHLRSPNGG
uniref:PPM-type phosphatase domain-containing protein n=1 Tax=Panagrolaimus superbus TaxID=310955 RepID=A0A914Z9A9_9BILA